VAKAYAAAPSRGRLLAYGALAFVAFFQYEPGTLVGACLLVWFIRQRVRDALLMPISDPRVISSSIGALSHDC